jgi:hypothetical protein
MANAGHPVTAAIAEACGMKNEDKMSAFVQSLHEVLEQLDEMQLHIAAVKVSEAIDILKRSVQQDATGEPD